MGWNITDIPDLNGKIAVVTGANSGLGLESAKALRGAGAPKIDILMNNAGLMAMPEQRTADDHEMQSN
jgi:NADP-dependent 3-hydroxy acid dehydrogenase YdfG